MKIGFAIALALASGAALGANKCVLNGKIEYMDTPCPTEATSTTVRTDRANSLDTSHSYSLGRAASKNMACDEARETHRHNPSREQRAIVAQQCGPQSAQERARLRAQQDAADERMLKASRDKLLQHQRDANKSMSRALSR